MHNIPFMLDQIYLFIFIVPTSTPKSSNNNSNDGSNSLTPLIQLLEDKKDASNRSLNVSEASTGSQKKKKKRISLTSSLSKVFSRGKARRSIALSQTDADGNNLILHNIAPDRAFFFFFFFSNKKYWYIAYFNTKTYVVGTH